MEECKITFPGPVSRKTMARLAIEYLKYILYYRGQFPFPLDQLKDSQDNEAPSCSSASQKIDGHIVFYDDTDHSNYSPNISTRVSSSHTKQKFLETVSKFDTFFDELTRILQTKKVMEIVLNLGCNMMNPKELYIIKMPVMCSSEECTADYASLQNCKMQLFRNVITSNIWTDLKSDSLLPISILLLLEKDVPLEEHMEQKRFYSLPKNCKQRTLHFMDQCNHVDNSSESTDKMKTSGLWVKLKPDLKGFKSYKESNKS